MAGVMEVAAALTLVSPMADFSKSLGSCTPSRHPPPGGGLKELASRQAAIDATGRLSGQRALADPYRAAARLLRALYRPGVARPDSAAHEAPC